METQFKAWHKSIEMVVKQRKGMHAISFNIETDDHRLGRSHG